MALPTDRGYVTITDAGDGTQRVDVYAKKSGSGPSHKFASHTGITDMVIEVASGFAKHGKTRVSNDQVQVSFDETQNRLYILELSSTSTMLE